jgi:ankyrin repeat protein
MFRQTNKINQHAYVVLRELGAVRPRQQYYERTYAALHPACYHQIKSDIKTDQEWLYYLESYHVSRESDHQGYAFITAILKGDVTAFTNIIETINLGDLLEGDLNNVMFVKNPFSPFQLKYSYEIHQAMWKSLTTTIHDASLLIWAVMTHQPISVFEKLLPHFSNLNDINNILYECLVRSCALNQTETVAFLLNQKFSPLILHAGNEPEIDFDDNMQIPLASACENGNYEMVKLLLDNGASTDYEENLPYKPLRSACMSGDPRIVRMLLEHKSDVHCLPSAGHEPEETPPIVMVCQSGNIECAKILLEYGAFINADSQHEYSSNIESYHSSYEKNSFQSPLFEACMAGHFELAEFLLSQGADIHWEFNIETDSCRATVNKCSTFLHYAVQIGDYKLSKFLIEHGADINAEDDKLVTPVHLACEMPDKDGIEFISYLVEKTKADWFFMDEHGNTPLLYLKNNCNFDQVNIIYILVRFLKNLDLEQLNNTKSFDNWSDIYESLIIDIDTISPDLLLQYAILSKQEESEIDRIIALGADTSWRTSNQYNHYDLAKLCYPEIKDKLLPVLNISKSNQNLFGMFQGDVDNLEVRDESFESVNEKKRARSPSMDRFGDSD